MRSLRNDHDIALRTAGTLIPDGSGRLVRNGVIVSAEDNARSTATTERNQFIDQNSQHQIQTNPGIQTHEIGSGPSQFSRFGGQAFGHQTQQASQIQQANPLVVSEPSEEEYQRAMAVLRNAGPIDGKDYSEESLKRVSSSNGGRRRVVMEASNLPVIQQRIQTNQMQDHVGELHKQSDAISTQISAIESAMPKLKVLDPANNPQDKAAIEARAVLLADANGGDPLSYISRAESELNYESRLAYEGSNSDNLKRLKHLQDAQRAVSDNINDFAKQGIFARQPSPAMSPLAAAASAAESVNRMPTRAELVEAQMNASDAADRLRPAMGLNRKQHQVSRPDAAFPEGAIGMSRADGGYTVIEPGHDPHTFKDEAEAIAYYHFRDVPTNEAVLPAEISISQPQFDLNPERELLRSTRSPVWRPDPGPIPAEIQAANAEMQAAQANPARSTSAERQAMGNSLRYGRGATTVPSGRLGTPQPTETPSPSFGALVRNSAENLVAPFTQLLIATDDGPLYRPEYYTAQAERLPQGSEARAALEKKAVFAAEKWANVRRI